MATVAAFRKYGYQIEDQGLISKCELLAESHHFSVENLAKELELYLVSRQGHP